MGKNKAIVHKFFNNSPATASATGKARKDQRVCKYCSWITTNNVTRMVKHIIEICSKCPKRVKNSLTSDLLYDNGKGPSVLESFRLHDAAEEIIDDPEELVTPSPQTPSTSTSQSPIAMLMHTPISRPKLEATPRPTSRPKSSMSIDSFCDKMNSKEEEECNEVLARAIYATAAPLSLVDNPYWTVFFKKLRPAYNPPSRFAISNKLLEDEVNRVKMVADDKIRSAETLGLMCDGWTNIRRESIVNFVITTPTPVFYESLPTKAERHTGEYTAKCIEKILLDNGSDKFFGIVTDNASNMKRAWTIINEKYPHIVTYGCIAHGLSLLINDCIKLKSLIDLVNEGKAIVKEILNGHILKAVFDQKQTLSESKISLKLPVVTRWGSVCIFLNSILQNKGTIRAVCVDEKCEKDLKASTKRSILNDVFWDKASNLQKILEPIAHWIAIIEGDTPQMSLTCEIFYELAQTFEKHVSQVPCLKAEEKKLLDFFEVRKHFCLKPIHKAANMLDPKYKGKHLSPSDQIEVAEFICTVAGHCAKTDDLTVMAEYAQFKLKTGIFSKEYLWVASQNIPGHVWWQAFCSHTQLSIIATKILCLPATSAACERTFSSYKDVHSLKRNRLLTERAGKLVYVKHNLKLQQQELQPSHSQPISMDIFSTNPKDGMDHAESVPIPDHGLVEDEWEDEELNLSSHSDSENSSTGNEHNASFAFESDSEDENDCDETEEIDAGSDI